MSQSVLTMSLVERYRIGRVLRPLTEKHGPLLDGASRHRLLEAVSLMEAAVEESPQEWVYWYTLGDWYQDVGKWVESLRACQRCVELRPNDVRSSYALATGYNTLTRAAWLGKEIPAEARSLARFIRDSLDPELSQRELERAGLDLSTAAREAIRWFDNALSLDPDRESRKMISTHLGTLHRHFPEVWVAQRTPKGPRLRVPRSVVATLVIVAAAGVVALCFGTLLTVWLLLTFRGQ